ncbi:fatty-acid--CoA ligase [Haloarcula sp. Atlit-47R]|uniref:long-chain fatty acid--CoA ligase n=1 Tax=Haloarcula sp. Atlit-47R TaxID=2282132 RepID=UPI000EF20FD4|nr:long-chain fatty acid--CoA ligase [Haloarcula sp. Atlit-47R]RLM41356.1 fatty-acid--CoA ligase [Haloarcula sp. Atlit-47R]
MPGGSPQTLRPFLWRAETLYPDTEVVSRTHEGIVRHDYAEYAERTAQLANAIEAAGYGDGERLGTFCWNHSRHFETYFGVPGTGAQLHTINPLLPDKHIQYIVSDAQDELIFVDESLLPKLEGAAADDPDSFETVEQFVVMSESVPDTDLDAVAYESFIADQPTEYDWPELEEERPAGLCYTSGTTGRPKGVEYTQQMLWSHTMAIQSPQGIPLDDDDVVMPVVPMFHVNAWGLPFSATAGGAKHVYPGPQPEPADLAKLIEEEDITVTAGVPTVWLGLMEYIKENDVDLSSLERLIVGGSAAPEAMIRFFDDHDVELVHAWGMTETAPVGAVASLRSDLADADYQTQLDKRAKQGLVTPGLEFRVIDDDGNEVPHNGEDFGELHIRGPWVTTEYFKRPEANEQEFEDGYLKTGDVVSVDEDGYIKIVDRAKDVIKSGGEWISSLELENELIAHDDVNEAAVIGVPHERWQERPLAMIVPTADADEETLGDELRAHILDSYPKWWVPDNFITIDEVPKTATGKFDKKSLRDEYADESLVEGRVPDDAAPE